MFHTKQAQALLEFCNFVIVFCQFKIKKKQLGTYWAMNTKKIIIFYDKYIAHFAYLKLKNQLRTYWTMNVKKTIIFKNKTLLILNLHYNRFTYI